MATVFGTVNKVIHEVSNALIDHQITKKLSDTVTSSINVGFDVVEDLLKVARDLTKEEEA